MSGDPFDYRADDQFPDNPDLMPGGGDMAAGFDKTQTIDAVWAVMDWGDIANPLTRRRLAEDATHAAADVLIPQVQAAERKRVAGLLRTAAAVADAGGNSARASAFYTAAEITETADEGEL